MAEITWHISKHNVYEQIKHKKHPNEFHLFSDKFQQNIHSSHLTTPKSQGLSFTIEHYAGKVRILI